MVVGRSKHIDAIAEGLQPDAKVEPRAERDQGVKPFGVATHVEARTGSVGVNEENHVSVVQLAMRTCEHEGGSVPDKSVEFGRQHPGMTW